MIDIRPATADDLPRIEQIYDAIHTAEEAGTASVGWARGVYPTRATAQAARDDGALFVLTDGGALVAAGSVITEPVPADALGLGRARQVNIEGWAADYRRRLHEDDEV